MNANEALTLTIKALELNNGLPHHVTDGIVSMVKIGIDHVILEDVKNSHRTRLRELGYAVKDLNDLNGSVEVSWANAL